MCIPLSEERTEQEINKRQTGQKSDPFGSKMDVLPRDFDDRFQLTSLSLRGRFVRREEDQRALRSRSLNELADALDEAARMLAALDLSEEQISTALDLHVRILAARAEVDSLRLSGAGRDRQLVSKERAAILWQ